MIRIVLLLIIFTPLTDICEAFARNPVVATTTASLTTTSPSGSGALSEIIPALVPLVPYVPVQLYFPGMQSLSSPETTPSANTKAPSKIATSLQTASTRRTPASRRTESFPTTAVSRRNAKSLTTASSTRTTASTMTTAFPRTTSSTKTITSPRTTSSTTTKASNATTISSTKTTTSPRTKSPIANAAFPRTPSSTKTVRSPKITSSTITTASNAIEARKKKFFSKVKNFQKQISKLIEECDFGYAEEVYGHLRDLWSEVIEEEKHIARKSRTKATSSKQTDLQKFAVMLREECNFDMLDEVAKDLKNLWAKVMKGEEGTSRVMNVREYLENLVDDYNNCSENSRHMDLERQWEIYLKIFGKEYTAKEKEMKKTIFRSRKEDVEKHNELYRKGLVSYTANLNQLSDWTEKELEILCGFQPSNKTHRFLRKRDSQFGETVVKRYNYNPSETVPASVDWRTTGYVNPVSDQGNCGSCYAMSGLGALEAYHKKRSGQLVMLSTQNILDCTWHLGNTGCDAGFPDLVFMYAQAMGVMLNSHYPYTMNASHDCLWKYEHVVARDQGYYISEMNNELALRNAVANHGPVAVGIGTKHLYEYRAGVFYTEDCGNLNHATLVVGYGTDPIDGDYWIIKNSWGFWWGENGYVRMARNKNNMCQIAKCPTFPF